MSTVELPDSFTTLQFSPHGIAFLCDATMMQRYLEISGQLGRAISVVKVRGSNQARISVNPRPRRMPRSL